MTNLQIEYLCDRPEHVEQVAKWLYSEWGRHKTGSSVELIEARLRGYFNKKNIPLTVVAVDGPTLLGTATLRESDLRERKNLRPWMASVYVAPEHRNRGVGTALVSAIERIGCALNFARIYLFTPDRQSFYSRQDWILYENVDHDGQPVSVMFKNLKSES